VAVDLTRCEFCGNCQKRCAPGAITLDREQRTLALERLRCIGCGVCTEVCASKSLTMADTPLGAFDREEVGPDGSSPRGVLTARQAAPPPGSESAEGQRED
jgi:MinD superfamily P-loop ATPase